MNNKGQSLVSFIIVFPVLIIICLTVIEFGYIAYEKHHFVSVTKTIINSMLLTDKSLDKDKKDDIIKLYNDNNIQVEDISIEDDDGLKIVSSLKIDSKMGKIINKNYYIVKISIKGKLNEDNKVVFDKG